MSARIYILLPSGYRARDFLSHRDFLFGIFLLLPSVYTRAYKSPLCAWVWSINTHTHTHTNMCTYLLANARAVLGHYKVSSKWQVKCPRSIIVDDLVLVILLCVSLVVTLFYNVYVYTWKNDYVVIKTVGTYCNIRLPRC